MGGKLSSRQDHLDLARRLTEGCIWAYTVSAHGVMPETFSVVPCTSKDDCEWDQSDWKKRVIVAAGERLIGTDSDSSRADEIIVENKLPEDFMRVSEGRYILRPEAIESVFVLYRTSGRADLVDTAGRCSRPLRS